VLAILLNSFSVRADDEVPSWVQGIRNGSEGIKLIAGNKIFYRRIVSDIDGDKNLTCQKAVEAAEESLKSEIFSEVKIPYTLEIIFYDPKIKDCAATISISSSLMGKLLELNHFKNNEKIIREDVENKLEKSKQEKVSIENKYNELKKIINENADLFKKYNDMVSDYDRAKSITNNRFKKTELLAVTGLRKKEFESMLGEQVKINFDSDSLCYKKENKIYSSYHAGLNVCWTSSDWQSEIVSFCYGNNCYTR
jgi:hypothetical protein